MQHNYKNKFGREVRKQLCSCLDTQGAKLTCSFFVGLILHCQSGTATPIPSERLASLGIMGAQFRARLKPPVHHCTIVLRGMREPLPGPLLCRETLVSGHVFFRCGCIA